MSVNTGEDRCPACAAPRPDAGTPCVECGARPTNTVTQDVPCRRCGYSLRGLDRDGVCPECSAPVQLSMMGDFLAGSDPAHVSRLVRGAMMVEITLYLGVLMMCVGSPMTVAIAPPGASAIGAGLIILVNLALTVVGLIGWWMVASRDPGLSHESRGEPARRTLRFCLLISLAANVLGSGGVVSGSLVVSPGLSAWLTTGGVVLGVATWIVQYFASVSYVRALAARIPSPSLAETARTTLLMPIWTFGLGIPLLAATAVISGMAPPAALVAILIGAGMLIACLVWFIWYCSMVSGLRDRLETVRATMPRVIPD